MVIFSRGVAEDLKLLDIKSVQITIDGPPEIHNKRRKVINGEDSFDVILRNIRNIYDLLDITIRINVDSSKYKKY